MSTYITEANVVALLSGLLSTLGRFRLCKLADECGIFKTDAHKDAFLAKSNLDMAVSVVSRICIRVSRSKKARASAISNMHSKEVMHILRGMLAAPEYDDI